MSRHIDTIVLGQGLAGTAIAWWLKWCGCEFLVVERETGCSSSRIAAGLITPITGQKLVKAWRFDELWPVAQEFYQRVEEETGCRFFHRTKMVRLFENENERSAFQGRLASGEYMSVLSETPAAVDLALFKSDHGQFEMNDGGQLSVAEYLTASRASFRMVNRYLNVDLCVSRDLELTPKGVRIVPLDVTARRVIFCQGFDHEQNPWFHDVRFKPAKGEILTLRIPGLQETRVVHRGVWLAPLGRSFQSGINL